WRNHLDSSLVRCIHRSRGEVIRVAIDNQSQRLLRVPRAEIDFNPMQLGESRERQLLKIGDVLAITFGDQRQHIISLVVPSSDGRAGAAARDHAEFRKWRSANESLI